MRHWPLRIKISLLTAVLGGLALLVFGSVVVWRVAETQMERLDLKVAKVAETFFRSLPANPESVRWNNTGQVRRLFGDPRHAFVYEIVRDGKFLHRSPGLGAGSLPSLATAEERVTLSRSDLRLRHGTFHSGDLELRLGLATTDVDAAVKDLIFSYAIALPCVVLGIGLLGYWLARRALRPVEDLAASADHITAQRLNERLPAPRARDEIGHLTDVLNRMMDRLQGSFEQTRRFSADASHELKTPLTIIRGEIEAALRSGQLPSAVEKTMLNLQEETKRLITIVEGLLLLSQADAGKLKLELRPVDLSLMIEEIIEDVEILAAPQGLTLEIELAPAIFVDGEPQFLRQLLLNLFDNAIKYNVPEGDIRVELKPQGDRAVFTIRNSGISIPPEERERVFHRFHRAEPSRARRTGGQGLGLSICREIARAHGGEITLVEASSDWTIFQVTLPRSKAVTIPKTMSTSLEVEKNHPASLP